MKKLIKWLFTLFFGLLLLTLIWGFFLDSHWEIDVRQNIRVKPAVLFQQLNDLRRWPKWTIWNQQNYPKLRMSFEGETTGPGAIQRWNDGHTDGILSITAIEVNQSLDYVLSMDEGNIQMQGRFTLRSRGEATDLRWQLAGDTGANPIARLMMLAYRPVIEKDLQTNLARLKQQLEEGL